MEYSKCGKGSEAEIVRTGAHEVGHTGDLTHPGSGDKDNHGTTLEKDNLMRTSTETSGVKINSGQLRTIDETVKKTN